jgi:pimeloyl-ACP methyl ester carboxylesterase
MGQQGGGRLDICARAPQFVDLGHSKIAYRAVGSGAPLLLVYGYPLSGLTYRHVVPHLAHHFTCYIPDLPGAGDTQWTKDTDFNFKGQAASLKAFVDALGLPSYSIIAHDTGATISRRLAIIDAARVTQFVIIGTEIPGHRPPWIQFFQKVANPNSTIVFRTLLKSKWFRHSSAGFGGCFGDHSLIEGEFFKLFLQPLIESAARASGQTRYLMGIDWEVVDSMKTEHAKITAPTLLLWGENDPVFPASEACAMANQLPNCKGFVTVPKAKLFVHEEFPDTVAKIALEFFAARA